jgi:hypothetical protein
LCCGLEDRRIVVRYRAEGRHFTSVVNTHKDCKANRSSCPVGTRCSCLHDGLLVFCPVNYTWSFIPPYVFMTCVIQRTEDVTICNMNCFLETWSPDIIIPFPCRVFHFVRRRNLARSARIYIHKINKQALR